MKQYTVVLLGCLFMFMVSGCAGGTSGNVTDPGPSGKRQYKVITFEAIGKGLEPENALTIGEARLMAERAAVADGYRKLVEQIHGVYVDAYMKSGNGYVNYDAVQTHTRSWLRGTEVVSVQVAEHNITEARLRLRINFMKDRLVWWPVGLDTEYTPRWSSYVPGMGSGR